KEQLTYNQLQSSPILEAFTTSKYFSSLNRYIIRSSTMPPLSLGRQLYCALPSVSFEASFEVTFWIKSKACSPVTRNSPIWETSNTPTPLRTVSCSTFTPSYETGIL